MMIRFCGRYSVCISMLILVVVGIGAAADVRSPAPQEWDSIVKSREEGQVTDLDRLDRKAQMLGGFSKALPKINYRRHDGTRKRLFRRSMANASRKVSWMSSSWAVGDLSQSL